MTDLIQSKKLFNWLIVTILILSALYLGVLAINKLKATEYIGRQADTVNTITVSDSGSIYVKPDLAQVSVAVRTEMDTVEAAVSENARKMNTVIETVKSEGVEEKDLKTTNFSIYPRYEYEKTTCTQYYCPQGERILVGYEVFQSLEIKIRDLQKTGTIINIATKSGANEIGSLQFTVDKIDEFKAQARKEAIDKAKAKAKVLSENLGVDLVRITSFSENGVYPMYDRMSYAKEAAGGGESVAPEIQTGENKIEVTVSISYEIK